MKNRFLFAFKILALIAGVTFLAEAQSADYDVVKRFKLLEDKFATHEMLTPLGHDFLIDIHALLNKDLFDFIDEADAVSKTQGSDAQKIAAAQTFLHKYDKTEQNVRVRLNLGFPLPSFTVWGVKLVPDFRVGAGLGILMGIRTTTFDINNILQYVGNDIDPALLTYLQSCNFSGITSASNKDIVQFAVTNCGVPAAVATPYLNKYYAPSDLTAPNVFNYVKGEARAGFYVGYEKGEHWFGNVNLYGLARADAKIVVTDAALAGNGEVGELPDELNTTMNMVTDLKFGYKNGNLQGFAAVEELKIARMSDNEAKAGKLLYGEDALIRVQGDYLYKFVGFDLKPFAGTHVRSGYGAGDGFYAGGDIGYYVWNDRIGLRFRTMVDKEHLTISPAAKLWFMHIEYMLKTPMKSEVDGVKPSTLHSLNFRLFF